MIDGLQYIKTGKTFSTLSPDSNDCPEKPATEAATFFKRQFAVVLCLSVAYSSPQSLALPQTASDNDEAYAIMSVNTCVAAAGGGRVELTDVSTE